MMRLHCIAGLHDVAPGEVRNQGLEFSHCRSCGRDMIRSRRHWRTVPKGFRVVWKRVAPRRTEIDAAQLFFDLPSAERSRTIPSPGQRRRGSGLLDLVVAGLRYFAWSAVGRLQAWRRTLSPPHTAGRPILRLTSWATSESGI
jgi:hypothetical protein